MKVCFLAGTLGRGGAEKQLVYMIKALKQEGISVRVLCLTRGESYEKDIENLGVEIEWVGESQGKAGRLIKIIKSLRKESADILQSAHFYTNLYAGICGRILNIKSIGAIRNDLKSEIEAHGRLGKWQISATNSLIANSRLAFNLAVENGISPKRINFVPNVIEISDTEYEKISEAETVIRVIFVGRLVDQKRPEIFISLARVLTERFPSVSLRFQIAGDGPLRSGLEKMAAEKGLTSDSLTFLGEKEDLSDVYKSADILVLTSGYEGVPNALLEAMSNGIPVVATDVGAVSEIITNGNGMLVERDDFDGLVDAASRLIADKNIRNKYGEHGRTFVMENHSIGNLGSRLKAVYSNLIGHDEK